MSVLLEGACFTSDSKCFAMSGCSIAPADRMPCVRVRMACGYPGSMLTKCAGAPGTGKTALASKLAVGSEFPLIKLISPEGMVGLTELSKVTKIKKVGRRHPSSAGAV